MKLPHTPLFTVVTPSLNCGAFIQRNLRSVADQGMAEGELEHWVIDGGSKDDTVGILQGAYGVKYVSEADRGLSDAVNKGISRAEGRWVIWLNADDELAPGALKAFLANVSQHPSARWFCGAQKVYRYDGSLETVTTGKAYSAGELLNGDTAIVQASTFVHREIYEKVGLLDESFRFAMDYEWAVRAAKAFPCVAIKPILSHYHRRVGSIMDKGIAGQHREFLRVRRMHGESMLSWPELRIRFFLLTEPLRRIRWLRRLVRSGKAMVGREPTHPMS